MEEQDQGTVYIWGMGNGKQGNCLCKGMGIGEQGNSLNGERGMRDSLE